MDYEWDMDKNADVKEAMEWAEWLSKVKDPSPCLVAAKMHAVTFLKVYESMAAELSGYIYGTP